VSDLTPTQIAIVLLAIEDKPDKAIADELKLSRHTVDWHWRQILAKTGRHSRVAAVVEALRIPVVVEKLLEASNSENEN